MHSSPIDPVTGKPMSYDQAALAKYEMICLRMLDNVLNELPDPVAGNGDHQNEQRTVNVGRVTGLAWAHQGFDRLRAKTTRAVKYQLAREELSEQRAADASAKRASAPVGQSPFNRPASDRAFSGQVAETESQRHDPAPPCPPAPSCPPPPMSPPPLRQEPAPTVPDEVPFAPTIHPWQRPGLTVEPVLDPEFVPEYAPAVAQTTRGDAPGETTDDVVAWANEAIKTLKANEAAFQLDVEGRKARALALDSAQRKLDAATAPLAPD
ncbi:MAG: hypothetical protein AAFY83_04085 [Pseudomonadota bacterium]